MRKISTYLVVLALGLVLVNCSHSVSPTTPAIQGDLQVLHITLLSGATGDSIKSIPLACGSQKAKIFVKNIGQKPMSGMYVSAYGVNTDPEEINPGQVVP